jgi:hypothetical protein
VNTTAATIQARETHQKTIDKIFDVLTAQEILLVAVASSPGVQPFFGRRNSELPCNRGACYGQRIHEGLTLIHDLWGNCHARVVEMHPHCPIAHCAPHSVSRTGHGFRSATNNSTKSKAYRS